MKKLILNFSLSIISFLMVGHYGIGQPDTLLQFLTPFIGEWHIPQEINDQNNQKEHEFSIGFKFEWAHENQKILRFYEGIPDGDMDKRILENLVVANPRTGEVEFLGYQMRDDFLFKGRFEPLEPGPGFIRLYDVYYPNGTVFKQRKDEIKGLKSYRDICRVIGKDTLRCSTEQLDFGQWKPWGKGVPYLLVREIPTGHVIPQWLLDDWAERTKGNGHWITDNTAHKNSNEPYDGYGLEWKYGLGNSHLKGRLYGIVDGKDVATFWNFTEYWDPKLGKVRIVQIGSDGTVGQGTLWHEEDGSTKEKQTFVSPGGGSLESGHHLWIENGENHTQSYNIINGEWVKRRFYIWKRK